jgi:uncharacterized membrane protein
MNTDETKQSISGLKAWVVGWLSVAVLMLVLDLTWLGVAAREIYAQALGELLRPQAHLGAALLFYAMYVSFVVGFAVLDASTLRQAAIRGAGMGFFAYATYELTNWAVITNWPPELIVVDVLWGTFLTGLIAFCGRLLVMKVAVD